MSQTKLQAPKLRPHEVQAQQRLMAAANVIQNAHLGLAVGIALDAKSPAVLLTFQAGRGTPPYIAHALAPRDALRFAWGIARRALRAWWGGKGRGR